MIPEGFTGEAWLLDGYRMKYVHRVEVVKATNKIAKYKTSTCHFVQQARREEFFVDQSEAELEAARLEVERTAGVVKRLEGKLDKAKESEHKAAAHDYQVKKKWGKL